MLIPSILVLCRGGGGRNTRGARGPTPPPPLAYSPNGAARVFLCLGHPTDGQQSHGRQNYWTAKPLDDRTAGRQNRWTTEPLDDRTTGRQNHELRQDHDYRDS